MNTIALLCFLSVLYHQTDSVLGKAIQTESTDLTFEENSCVNELHLNKIEMQEKNNRETTPEDDDHYNKFLTCAWKKIDWVRFDGTINYENMEQTLEAAVLNVMGDKSPFEKLTVEHFIQTLISYCKARIVEKAGNTLPMLQNCIVKNIL